MGASLPHQGFRQNPFEHGYVTLPKVGASWGRKLMCFWCGLSARHSTGLSSCNQSQANVSWLSGCQSFFQALCVFGGYSHGKLGGKEAGKLKYLEVQTRTLRESGRQNCGKLQDVLFTKDQAALVANYSGLGIWSGFGITFLLLFWLLLMHY